MYRVIELIITKPKKSYLLELSRLNAFTSRDTNLILVKKKRIVNLTRSVRLEIF